MAARFTDLLWPQQLLPAPAAAATSSINAAAAITAAAKATAPIAAIAPIITPAAADVTPIPMAVIKRSTMNVFVQCQRTQSVIDGRSIGGHGSCA
jgi:hypothetical protein